MDNRKFRWGRAALVPLAVTGALFLAACSDDEDPAEETTTSTATSEATGTATSTATEAATETATSTAAATETATEAAGETVEVTTVDYAFEGLPETIAAGSQIVLTNESEGEVHEFVAFLIPEDETRSAEELLALPQEEAEAIVGEPQVVIVAPPGTGPDENFIPVGDGTLTEPGRYVVLCSIPIGADPEALMAGAEGSGTEQPEVEGGPPHFTEGMFAELTVE